MSSVATKAFSSVFSRSSLLGLFRGFVVLLIGAALVIVVQTTAPRIEATADLTTVPSSDPVLTAAAPVVAEETVPDNYLGEVIIPKIAVTAPMYEPSSFDQEVMTKELERGVIHIPETAAIGMPGNTVIAGHSSFYPWVKSDYKTIFKDLGDLNTGDFITVRVPEANNTEREYMYRVTEKRVVMADDEWIFEQPGDKNLLTLGTCWPIGTTLRRLMVRAELMP